ncbi:hypothetical protein [Natronorubrum halophilum]|uniref:hypothetical protein n=1 Tax=Natronorubrum halophilum TaxID=1702106 RepID=UPI0010C241D3|nr:hypothetical protein [Natronorubrum halophilum]
MAKLPTTTDSSSHSPETPSTSASRAGCLLASPEAGPVLSRARLDRPDVGFGVLLERDLVRLRHRIAYATVSLKSKSDSYTTGSWEFTYNGNGPEEPDGLKVVILGLQVTLLGFAIDPGYPLFVIGFTVSACGFLID